MLPPPLLLLLLRLLTGLRSADGACEPRCLHPPSPPPRIETTSLLSPARSPLITVTPRMCCPRPHPPPPPPPHPPRFLVPLLLRLLLSSPLLSLPLLVSYRRPSTSDIFAFRSALSLLLPESYPSFISLCKSYYKKKRKENRKQNGKRTKRGDAAASTALSATRRGEQRRPGQQERGCSFTMLRRLVLQSRRSESDGEQWGEKINVIISSPNHCQNMFPES